MSDWNAGIVKEFRANDGKVGGMFEGASLLILHTTGAKSGEPRVSPLVYQDLDGRYAIFASKAGAPSNPDWFYNLKANPDVSKTAWRGPCIMGTSTIFQPLNAAS